MHATNLATSYNLPLLEWEPVAARLDDGFTQAPGTGGPSRHTCWLATIDADGRPHVSGVGGFWHEGTFWFQTGEGTRKGRNLARDPRCTMSLAVEEFDLVLEGDARPVTDPALVAEFVRQANEGGWPARVDESGTRITAEFSAPSAGPPPWTVYQITPRAATALATTGDGGATRWRW